MLLDVSSDMPTSDGWLLSYTLLFDRHNLTAAADSATKRQQREQRATRHNDMEYISQLLNVEYALGADAWVCTLISNTCRIIDELR